MTKSVSFEIAKQIMGDNIISPNDLKELKELDFVLPNDFSIIPFSKEELIKKSKDYLLIYGCSLFQKKKQVNILNLKDIFGDNPSKKAPCFYFQDWYNNESFIRRTMNEGWFLIRKQVYEESRKVLPNELDKIFVFPSAIQCAYAFFVTWLVLGMKLWYNDFVWCSDLDHNGDRIYVGKYNDIDGINKDGFSIHRHLSLRPCYGCIDCN